MCLVLRKKHFTKVWIIFVNCKFDLMYGAWAEGRVNEQVQHGTKL